MSLFNIGDWFAGNAQTQAEADANLARQQAQLRNDVLNRNQNGVFQASDARDLQLSDPSQFTTNSTTAAAGQGFVEGLGDGLTNIKNSVTGFGLLKLIPIWIWIVGAVALFVWMGGLTLIKGSLKKKA